MATTAMVSRRIGEKNKEGASIAASQSIIIGFTISVLLAVPGIFFSHDLLLLMGAETEVADSGYAYPSIMITTNSVIMLLFIINAVFRSAGDAALSMRVLWWANLCNIVLDPILIFGLGPIPALGIKGAAIATVIGRGSAVLFQFYILFKGKGRVNLSGRHLVIDPIVLKKLIKLSYGGIGQYLISTSSWIGLMRILAVFGSEVLAGYTIAIRIIIFSLLPSWGLSNAAATLVGQNLGAKKPDRAEKSVWRTGFINLGFLSLFAVVFISKPSFFIGLFIDDPIVIEYGSTALRIISFGYLCYAFGMVMPQAFNGAGDTATPTWMNFICFWLAEIPIAYLFALVLGWEEKGVFYAIVLAETLLAVLGIVLFRMGRWKLKVV
jgi:putative MATE family efflux protein